MLVLPVKLQRVFAVIKLSLADKVVDEFVIFVTPLVIIAPFSEPIKTSPALI
jgi:hypothetical protein